jgi:polygalacturonase
MAAKGDAATDNTMAFKMAIADCAAAGGGHVIVPSGKFVSGAIELLDNIDRHLDAGATIAFSGDISKYPLVYSCTQRMELMNHSPPIYAYGRINRGLTGSGTLDAAGTARLAAPSGEWLSVVSLSLDRYRRLEVIRIRREGGVSAW